VSRPSGDDAWDGIPALFVHDEDAPRLFLVPLLFQGATETIEVPDGIFGFIDPVLEADVDRLFRANLEPMFPAGEDGMLGRDSDGFPAGRYRECRIGADPWRFPPACGLPAGAVSHPRAKDSHTPFVSFDHMNIHKMSLVSDGK
jgi:hypothetical protein